MPRSLHPAAWWVWALALGAAALRTKNPLVLFLIGAVAWLVVASRRGDAPWARSFGSFVRIGIWVVGIRLALQVLFAVRLPGHVLFSLPSVALPSWLAGVTLGGPVTTEALLTALYEGVQLAVLLACVGAANSLASPYRLLRCLPTVLYEAGVVVTVALSFAPQASTTVHRVQEARRLRGRPHTGVQGLRGLAVPVLEGALDRSLFLAASMDARGYGRRASIPEGRRRLTTVALGLGVLATLAGAYGLLDDTSPAGLGLPALACGAVLLAGALALGGARSSRSRYRPDPWALPEWITVASGLAAYAGVALSARLDAVSLNPGTSPIVAPSLPVFATIGVLLAAVPAFATPRPAP
jgi:energy-coupling factor transport system permease protein